MLIFAGVMRKLLYILFTVVLLSLFSCGGAVSGVESAGRADSLCLLLDDYRYKSVEKLSVVAGELLNLNISDEYNSVAKASLAYSAMMRMDFCAAKALYDEVHAVSHCEIERLAADVGMMILCYRVSANREFFDYRAMAQARMRRIEEEAAFLPPADKARFVRAKVEFEVVSLCYFSNIGLVEEAQASREALSLEIEECDDVALRIYARMMLAAFETDVTKRAEAYALGLSMAKRSGLTWLTGNYRLLLAITLRGEVFSQGVPAVLERLNTERLPYEEFSLLLAGEAVSDFSFYGDNYMKIEALAVAASCNTQIGEYSKALVLLGEAVDEVNAYYKEYGSGVIDTLSLGSFAYFDEAEDYSFLQNGTAVDIPECLLSIRREASCAYAGLGDKELSDINREAYLDLLRTTRMNRLMESRVQAATSTASRLYWLSLLVVAALVVVALLLWLMNRRQRRRNEVYSSNLKRLLKLTRKLLSSLPHELDSEEAVCLSVCEILSKGMEGFSGSLRFSLTTPFEVCGETPYIYNFSLPLVAGNRNYTLSVAAEKELDEEKKAILEMALPYVAVAVEEGLRIADIGDEQLRFQEQRLAHELYLAEYKRENLLKRVSASVVNGMRPYMDRIQNELRHLSCDGERAAVERRLQYVAELTDKLADYNVILERWIKMRRGDMSLQVERFSVREIFDVIEKSVPYFSARGIQLDVRRSDIVVRADRALTLFMVNTLVENAGKFTPSGGSIVVEAQESDNFVELSVTDSGVGLTQNDIDLILGEKVYDAALIGESADLSGKNKGGGFGLMNCKGIIEKYRKTDEIFSVCSMNISSRKGAGSRFSFRLPRGVVRSIVVLLAMVMPLSAFAGDILSQVSACADSVFISNVEGRYDAAYSYAEQAISGLNRYYREIIGGADTLSLSGGTAAEILWWREEIFPPSLKEDIYFNILDIRNELAVAALALQRWSDYRYNNGIYVSLYRLVHEDKGLEGHYENMQQLANSRQAAIALLLCVIILMLVVYAIYYVRHAVIGRMTSRMVLTLNRRLLAVSKNEARLSPGELAGSMSREIFIALGEAMCIDRVSMFLKNESVAVSFPEKGITPSSLYMRAVCDSGEPFVSEDKLLLTLPMSVLVSGEKHCVGALEFESGRPLSESEVLNLELVARYAASVAYHSTVRMAEHYRLLAAVEEDAERVSFEENRLHVQNMVMDNCLSVIKHETIYYPSRIKALVEQALAGTGDVQLCREKVAAMVELMDYYISVFGILSNCVTRQLDEMNLSCVQVPLADLFAAMRGFVSRKAKKAALDILLDVEPTSLNVFCDKVMVEALLESLLEASLNNKVSGVLRLCAVDEGDVVRIELLDKRLNLSKEALSLMFVPSRNNITADGGLAGMEYLVAKEVMRLHEDALLQRGGRIEARATDEGVLYLFTLPKKSML